MPPEPGSNNHISAQRQPEEGLPVVRRLQVELDAALIREKEACSNAVAVGIELGFGPERMSFRSFDHHHVGAEVGEHSGTPSARGGCRNIKYPKVAKRLFQFTLPRPCGPTAILPN